MRTTWLLRWLIGPLIASIASCTAILGIEELQSGDAEAVQPGLDAASGGSDAGSIEDALQEDATPPSD